MAYQEFTTEELATEEWRDIPDFPSYQASNLGRIRRCQPERNTYAGRVLKPSGDRYLLVVVMRDGKRYCRSVHSLTAQAFLLRSVERPQVNHIDGVKHNNKISNLEYCTHDENARHASLFGLVVSGERHPNTKISDRDVRTIREAYATGTLRMQDLANRFSIGKSQVKRILDHDSRKTA